MAEQERDEVQERDTQLEQLVSRYGDARGEHCYLFNMGSTMRANKAASDASGLGVAIHARVAQLVDQAREEGRQEGAKDLAKLDKDLAWEAKMGDRK